MRTASISSALLAALCAATFATQAPTPAAAQAGGAPGVQQTANSVTVTRQDGLVDAIKTATKALESSSVNEFTINIQTCDKQLLPREINAKGKIIIVGCKDSPAGVGGNDRAERTVLYPTPTLNAVVVKSPLEIRNAKVIYNHVGFRISDSITIKNSVFEHNIASSVREPRLLEFDYDLAKSQDKQVLIEQSTLTGARLHVGDFGRATYTLRKNVIDYDPRRENPTIDLTPVSGNPNKVTLSGNHVKADQTWLFGAFVKIQRPNVEITDNSFAMDRPHSDAIGFEVVNPSTASGAPIANVEIRNNDIKVPYVMINAAGEPLARDAVRFNQNRLAGSVAMLPLSNDRLDAKTTVSPKDRIDATGNHWGTIDRHTVQARTDNPLSPDAPQAPSSKEITVNAKDGLIGAIAEATKFLAQPQHKEVTIRVTTCDSQTMPQGIDAKGTIKIIGCGQSPAGISGNDKAQRTKLVFPPSRHGVIINSPVEIDGFVGDVRDKAFNPNDTLIVKNSVFTGKPQFHFGYATLFNATMPFTPDTKHLVLMNSTVENMAVFSGKGQTQNIRFEGNKVSFTPGIGRPAIAFYPNVSTKGTVEVINNAFVAKGSDKASAFMVIYRPDVHIAKNTFTAESVADDFATIRIFDMSPGDGPAIKNVKIEYNRFTGGFAVSNPKSTPLAKDAVRFNHNDVSKTVGVLPTGLNDFQTLYSTSPREAVDATLNYWDKLDRKKVHAITEPVETDKGKTGPEAYTPPAPKPPVNPPGGGGTGPGGNPNPGNPNPGNPGPGNPGPSNPGPSNPGPSNPGPSVPGPSNPGPSVPGPSTPVPPAPPSGQNDSGTGPASERGKKVRRFAGETRFETAAQISQAQFSTPRRTVILARADVAADSVTAAPLAEMLDAPILLTQPDVLHPAAAAELKRLLPQGGSVMVMGGEVAISKQVEAAVTAMGGKVERIAGQNRAGTAVETAKRLQAQGKVTEFLLADGTDWQADLIAGPVAAKVDGATLLTNGKAMAPETAAFLDQHRQIPVTAIGTTAKEAGKVTKAVEAADGSALSLAVAKQYFDKPKAVGLATIDDFADALAGGAHVAEADGPMLLTPAQVPAEMVKWIRSTPSIEEVYVYGGPMRISDAALTPITRP